MVISVDNKNYAIGWADSNNMENTVRDHIVSKINGNATMLEICSSDTHSTSGKRTREDILPLELLLVRIKLPKYTSTLLQGNRDGSDLHLSLLVPNQPSR